MNGQFTEKNERHKKRRRRRSRQRHTHTKKTESSKYSINFLTAHGCPNGFQCNKVKCLMGIWIDRESKIKHWIDFNLLFECVGLAAIFIFYSVVRIVDYVVPSYLVTSCLRIDNSIWHWLCKTSSRKMYFKPFLFVYYLCRSMTYDVFFCRFYMDAFFFALCLSHSLSPNSIFGFELDNRRCSIWAIKTLTAINTANPTCKYAHKQICEHVVEENCCYFQQKQRFFSLLLHHGIVITFVCTKIERWKLVMCAHITFTRFLFVVVILFLFTWHSVLFATFNRLILTSCV